jgi:large subunit ribosomal protein L4
VVLDEIQLDAPKTKVVAQMMARLGLPAALIVTGTQNVALERAARNLPSVKVLRAEGANVYDILRYPYLVLSRDALPALQERLTA